MNGSIDKYRTPTGRIRWRARWDLPPGPDGERRRQTRGGFATKAEAQRFLRETLAAYDRGGIPTSPDVLLRDYLTTWLAGKRIRATTRDNYYTCVHIHTIPRIGGMRLGDITHHTLNGLYRELETHGRVARPDPATGITDTCRTAGITCRHNGCNPERHSGLSTKSVQHVHGVLRNALQDAVREGLLIRNPADLASPPRRTAKQRRVSARQIWTGDQARAFLRHIEGDPLQALWMLALATGLRRGELVGLTWPAVDLASGTLEVRASTTTVRGADVSTDGKTDAAQRRLTLDPQLVDVLQRHRNRQERLGTTSPHQHVFTDEAGAPIRPQRLTNTFARLADEAGLPKIGIHGLRHTAATLMLNHGVPIHIVAGRLGHSDASTTLAVYAHVMPNDDRVAAQTMARLLLPDPPSDPPGATSARRGPPPSRSLGSWLGHGVDPTRRDPPRQASGRSRETPGTIGF